MTLGGKGGAKLSSEFVSRIEYMIEKTDMSFLDIGLLNGCSVDTISEINCGNTASSNRDDYPIRKHRNT